MNRDNLESLPDAELAEAVAVEVVGFRRMEIVQCGVMWIDREGAIVVPSRRQYFAGLADAVLPLLTPWKVIAESGIFFGETRWTLRLRNDTAEYEGIAPTFARAACLALLRAKRAEKGES